MQLGETLLDGGSSFSDQFFALWSVGAVQLAHLSGRQREVGFQHLIGHATGDGLACTKPAVHDVFILIFLTAPVLLLDFFNVEIQVATTHFGRNQEDLGLILFVKVTVLQSTFQQGMHLIK